MEEIIKLVSSYSILIVIAGLYLWDSISNKKKTGELEKQNNNILIQNSKCLEEMSTSNANISKTLEILQVTTNNTNANIEEIKKDVLIIKNEIERNNK